MRLVLLAAALAAAVTACATTPTAKTPVAKTPAEFKVVKTDVRIPFAGSSIRGFQVADDESIIFDAGGRWYRATVWEPCRRDLKFESTIALVSDPTDALDRFSRVIVDGNACPIDTLDQIEKPVRPGKEKPLAQPPEKPAA